MSVKGGEGLALKDKLSILFSAVALTISAASYYFTHLRVDDEALARVTDSTLRSADPAKPGDVRRGFVVFHVAFVNTGNRPVVVNAPSFEFFGTKDPGAGEGGFGGEAAAAAGAFPFVLPAKDIRLVPVDVPLGTAVDNRSFGRVIGKNARGADLHRLFVQLLYRTVDSSGQLYHVGSPVLMEIDVTADGWNGMRDPGAVGGRESNAATSLLDR